MGILKIGGKIFTTVINIRADKWLGASYLKQSIGHTVSFAKALFIPKKADRKESFEESLARLNLSEAQLKTKESEFLRLFAFHLLLAFVTFCYCVFLFYKKNWGGGCTTLCLSLYPLAVAFRFHFWLFQLKNRRLGCTIQEWWNSK